MGETGNTESGLTPAQQFLNDLWDEHISDEFTVRDTEATLGTMLPDAYVNHIPVMTGGVGREALREFYSKHFIPAMPPDTQIIPVSRTVGNDRLVDEMIFSFTHTQEMPWMLPGVAPTCRRVEIPLVAIIPTARASWPTSTFIGIRHRSSSNSACLTRLDCRLPEWTPREKCLIRACLQTN